MFILEDPYVSDLLAATVAELGLPVLDTPMARRRLVGSHVAPARPPTPTSPPRLHGPARGSTPTPRTPSAGSPSTSRPPTCRAASASSRTRSRSASSSPTSIPDYRFFGLTLPSCATFDPTRVRAPFIVKPAVGFFSMGVHVVDSADAWPAAVAGIEREVEQFAAVYPDQVLGLDRFVVEEVIEGEEFAVDAYYDADGTPGPRRRVRAPVRLGRRCERPRLLHQRRDHRAPRPARDGVPRRGGPPSRHLRLPGPRRAPHRRRRQRRAHRGQPDAVRRLVRHRHRPLRLRHQPVPLLPARGVPRLDRHRREDRRAHHGAHRRRTCRAAWISPRSSPSTTTRFAARFSRVLEMRPTDFNRYPVFAFTFVEVPSDDLSELHEVLHADLREHLRMR